MLPRTALPIAERLRTPYDEPGDLGAALDHLQHLLDLIEVGGSAGDDDLVLQLGARPFPSDPRARWEIAARDGIVVRRY